MKYTITKKPKTPNMLWDGKTKKIIAKFNEKGVFETDEKAVAEKLKELGHTVVEAEEEEKKTNVDEMTVDELKAYAKAHDIKLGRANKKESILEVIKKAEAEKWAKKGE